MANLITNDSVDENAFLQLSNGGMSVLTSTLSLAGSHLAREKYEIDLVTWIASRDQGIVGLGVVGFDLVDLPWSKQENIFGRQKEFLLQVIERVGSRDDMHHLDYDPPHLDEYSSALRQLVKAFSFDDVGDEAPSWWLAPDEQGRKCAVHGVYLHVHGCVVCNDQ